MKNLIPIAMMLTVCSASAQTVKVAEPEFINSYCILTSDSTYATLPKEQGTIGEHVDKVRKITGIFGKVADVVGAGGMIGAATSGSVGGVINGVRVMGAAGGVANAANAVSGLAGSSGMDIIFNGAHSPFSFKTNDNDIRLLIKGESNEADPMDTYRIVRFKASKKERRIQWIEFESSLIGTVETKKAGYVQFKGQKYGSQSYLLTIPANELEKGEYGIFYMSIITATAIPVGTFSVK